MDGVKGCTIHEATPTSDATGDWTHDIKQKQRWRTTRRNGWRPAKNDAGRQKAMTAGKK